MGKLKKQIGKRKEFESLEQEAFLNLLRTEERLGEGVTNLLRPMELSGTQYNVLRILRGEAAVDEETGIACKDIGQRMVTRDPDITRLLDRLEKAGLIARARSSADRRVVKTYITSAGLKVVEKLDRPVVVLHRKQLGHLGEKKLKMLIDLLEEARAKTET
jgi:DNA-binding MarR family transcriptional regulator